MRNLFAAKWEFFNVTLLMIYLIQGKVFLDGDKEGNNEISYIKFILSLYLVTSIDELALGNGSFSLNIKLTDKWINLMEINFL